jgi:hypothetical protein
MFDLPLRISFKTPEILAKRPQHFQIVCFEAKYNLKFLPLRAVYGRKNLKTLSNTTQKMPIASPFCNHFKGQPLTNNCEGKGSKTKEIAGNANGNTW